MIDFAVLIAVYNTPPEQLSEAVYSILNQKLSQPFNIIIVNDGSTSTATLAMMEPLVKLHGNIKLLHMEKNSGTAAALNFGHSHINSEYTAMMGSDDYSYPLRFAKQLAYMENNQPDVLGTNLFAFKDGDIHRKAIFTTHKNEIPDYQKGWLVNHGTVVYRNEVVVKAGGYNINFRRGQDVELWKRLFKNGHVFRNITEVLYAYRRP